MNFHVVHAVHANNMDDDDDGAVVLLDAAPPPAATNKALLARMLRQRCQMGLDFNDDRHGVSAPTIHLQF